MSAPVPLCRYIFPNGVRCDCAARSGFQFCRHHTPDALQRRTVPLDPPPPPRPRPPAPVSARPFSSLSHWRAVRRFIERAPGSQLQLVVDQLMIGLERGLISHRSAGALLHEIQKRRRFLSVEAILFRARELDPASFDLTDAQIADHVREIFSCCR